MKKILVLGYIIRAPFGGLCFHHLQYLLSLKNLGHEVLFYEDSDDYPGYYNSQSIEIAKHLGFDFINKLFAYYGLENKWVFFDSGVNVWHGLSRNTFLNFCSQADIVLNLSGVNVLREWWLKIPVRAFVDTDPVFTQIKNITDPKFKELAAAHTCHFSFGENIGRNTSLVPDDGFDWKETRQPVGIEIWKVATAVNCGRWTTVLQWDAYDKCEYSGEIYGMKSASFNNFIDLPARTGEKFELAIKADEKTIIWLENANWLTVGSLIPTKDSWSYQLYIAESKAEWSIAKQGYVKTRSGWFSERSLSYLASGKPVVVENTGFSDFLPVGEGVFCFSTLEEAVEHIARVNKEYARQCGNARTFVEEHFEGKSVLMSLLNRLS
ncbi:glycosyltransferase family 1 protein [Aridibaculum aurantiacum]|uniref:glycosyltransferase family 1 protein n=1 Tax=Aridibaculum aurantiacum TaxID=2810307 RepID=UPI001A964E1D|nr:glycosyltransferase family 1 protein [Aridibaculum aurantiacum]